MQRAKEEILRSTDGEPPALLDPFAGGGTIPLEAQRLGLAAHASDLNPVAVMINKAMIEIPPRFAGKPPVNRKSRGAEAQAWEGAAGLAEDVKFYGTWMKEEALRRIGHLYPTVQDEHGSERPVIACSGPDRQRLIQPADASPWPASLSCQRSTRCMFSPLLLRAVLDMRLGTEKKHHREPLAVAVQAASLAVLR